MKRKAILAASIMIGMGFVPMASSNHMSVGNQDAVGMSPEETPVDPSVSQERHTVGTTPTAQCFDDEGDDVTDEGASVADRTVEAANSDAFCGRLDYNPGTQFNDQSPEDQDLRGPIETFDVQYASYVGNYGLSTCLPYCLPGGIQAYRAAHDVMHDQGLSDDGETADDEDDGGWQEYAVNTLYPNALILANQETGTWEGNGWAHTIGDQQFIGFLHEDGGGVVDDQRLQELYDQEDLPADAEPVVCGFTPDQEVTISATQAGFCEVLFRWAAPQSDPTSPDFDSDDYSDACESPTYVCGQSQAAWYAQIVCKSTPLTASGTGCAGGWWFQTGPGAVDVLSEPFLADQPTWSDNDYDVWHWVVAPSPSACSGAQEPGFDFDVEVTGVDHPYLAHDLDVYTPAATAADEEGTESVQSYARNTVTGTLPVTQEDADSASEAVDLAEVLPGQVQKGDRIEPNAAGDDSQIFTLDRSELACDELFGGQETHIDPWKNVVDNKVHLDAVGEPTSGASDLYLNDDETQDASNRPGYAMYFTDGKIGMFTDKDDDGVYDQVGPGAKIDQIQAQGAYPMIWDIELDADVLEQTGDAEQAMQGGCTPGFSDFDWTVQAKEAGYGPETGLIQVVYLNEPTVLFNWVTSETFPFPGGDNAFVFLSDGFEKLLNNGTASQQQFVRDKIDDALANIPASNPNEVLAHEFTASGIKDFSNQCGEPTGGYTSSWGFTHTCGGEPGGEMCAGDTIVTQYTFENADAGNVLGGSQIPVLDVDGDGSGEEFPAGTNTWTDVDPFDGDETRNDDSCDRPPHTHDESYPDGCSGHQH